MYLLNNFDSFEELSLAEVIKKEKDYRLIKIARIEAKAEKEWFMPCMHINKSTMMFRPHLIRKIANAHNLKGWLKELSHLGLDTFNKDLWEHRFLGYMAKDYLSYLKEKKSIEIDTFDDVSQSINVNNFSHYEAVKRTYLYDICVYLSGEIFMTKAMNNAYANPELMGTHFLILAMRETRSHIHEGYGRLAKIIKSGSFELLDEQIEDCLRISESVCEKMEQIVTDYRVKYLANNKMGFYPNILFPTTYPELLNL